MVISKKKIFTSNRSCISHFSSRLRCPKKRGGPRQLPHSPLRVTLVFCFLFMTVYRTFCVYCLGVKSHAFLNNYFYNLFFAHVSTYIVLSLIFFFFITYAVVGTVLLKSTAVPILGTLLK